VIRWVAIGLASFALLVAGWLAGTHLDNELTTFRRELDKSCYSVSFNEHRELQALAHGRKGVALLLRTAHLDCAHAVISVPHATGPGHR